MVTSQYFMYIRSSFRLEHWRVSLVLAEGSQSIAMAKSVVHKRPASSGGVRPQMRQRPAAVLPLMHSAQLGVRRRPAAALPVRKSARLGKSATVLKNRIRFTGLNAELRREVTEWVEEIAKRKTKDGATCFLCGVQIARGRNMPDHAQSHLNGKRPSWPRASAGTRGAHDHGCWRCLVL